MLDIDRPLPAGLPTSTRPAGWLSPALHLSFLFGLIIVGRHDTSPADFSASQPTVPLAFVQAGGGPKGGGEFADNREGPPPRARRAGNDAVAVPPPAQRSWDSWPQPEAPAPSTSIPLIPQASGLTDVPGSVASIAMSVTTGGGPGHFRGIGTGDGHTAGDGRGAYPGTGGPGYGGSVEPPELLHQVRPSYTPAAMQARVRGIVVMEAVVERDGSVGTVKIVRSLDPTFGLDQEAVRAVRQWRFRPARRAGGTIPIVVTIELAFELR